MEALVFHPHRDYLVVRIPVPASMPALMGACGEDPGGASGGALTEAAESEIRNALAALARARLCFEVDYLEEAIDGRTVRACFRKVVPCDHRDEPYKPKP